MKWINFLHIYQLSSADSYFIKEATEKSYERIVKAMEENSKIKFTLNITGCLVLRWRELGYQNLIDRIRKLIKKGQIELVGSVSFHCLMPLTPEEEIEKQIKEDKKILKENFGSEIKLKGFFMPEMAYDEQSAKLIKKMGFEWIILDEIAFGEKYRILDFRKGYQDKASGLKVIFRSRNFSSCYLPDTVFKKMKENKSDFFITATDGELYGLRYKDEQKKFERMLKIKNLETETISSFLLSLDDFEKISLIACNWESTKEEIKNNKPYFSWFDEDNEIQKKLWELAVFSYKTIIKFKNDDNYRWARFHLSRGFASCTFWWASARDFSYIYGPHAWNPDEIERGVNEFIRAIRSLHDVTSRVTKIKAEKLHVEIKKIIWEKHWSYYWRKDNWEKISGEKNKKQII